MEQQLVKGHSLPVEELQIEFQGQAWTDDCFLCGKLVTQDYQYRSVSPCAPDLLALAAFSTDQHITLNRSKNSLQIFYVQLQDLKTCLDPKVE